MFSTCFFSIDRDLRVDFRCGDAAIPKYFLHGAQVSAVGKQIRCERVPQIMRRGFLIDSCSFLQSVIFVLNSVKIKLVPIFINKHFVRKTRSGFSVFQPYQKVCRQEIK